MHLCLPASAICEDRTRPPAFAPTKRSVIQRTSLNNAEHGCWFIHLLEYGNANRRDDDQTLPYAEFINWDPLAIVLHRTQLSTVLNTIRTFDLLKAQRALAAWQHVFTHEFTWDYIVRRLQIEACQPVPKAAGPLSASS